MFFDINLKQAPEGTRKPCYYRVLQMNYIMPPIPPMPTIPLISGIAKLLFSGLSTTSVSVVKIMAATDAAYCNVDRSKNIKLKNQTSVQNYSVDGIFISYGN